LAANTLEQLSSSDDSQADANNSQRGAMTDDRKLTLGTVLLGFLLTGCVAQTSLSDRRDAVTLNLEVEANRQLAVRYRSREPTLALHFSQELGGYRAEVWQPAQTGFRWVTEGDGERVERIDGKPFDRLSFTVPIDYRALPKSYGPFSPFSDGSTLIHSGQFHTCLRARCEGTAPLPTTIEAPGSTIGVEGRRLQYRASFVSREEGTNIFVGKLEPIETDGFIAVIDPGLPSELRAHLDRSLPQSMEFYAAIYGPLSFKPELYVSIDDRPERNGHFSTQGGTLPNQVFMHFDGENARERLATQNNLWLDWFFAHEAALLFQQDKVGSLASDDVAAWIHEGGADAMAALALVGRGSAERSYVVNREREAEAACGKGLTDAPLDRATAEDNFDLHYQCGLVIWLALDQDLRRSGRDGLNSLNQFFFAAVRAGETWSEATFLKVARQHGVSQSLIAQIISLSRGDYADATMAIEEVGRLARQSLETRE